MLELFDTLHKFIKSDERFRKQVQDLLGLSHAGLQDDNATG